MWSLGATGDDAKVHGATEVPGTSGEAPSPQSNPVADSETNKGSTFDDCFKRMMIPYTVNYPVNIEELKELKLEERTEKAKEKMHELGFFRTLGHDETVENTNTREEMPPSDSYSLTMSTLDEESKVWECMKTSALPYQPITKQMTRESVSFHTPSRMDYESLRDQYIIGRARIHWFPRYFGKSLGELSEHIKMCDIILDVRDARLPYVADSDFLLNVYNNMFTHKPKILVFTHADLASIKGMEDWGTYYRIKNFWEAQEFNKNIPEPNRKPVTPIIFVDAKNGISCIVRLKKLIYKLCARVNQRRLRRGLAARPLRAIALGMPNVGKSALINRLLGRHRSRSFNAPGVTKQINLVRLHPEEYREATHKIIDVIDTPGVLPTNLYNMAFSPIKGKSERKRNKLLGSMYFNLPKTPIPGGHSKSGIDAQHMRIERHVWLIAAANQIVEGAYDNDQAAEHLLEQMLEVYRQSHAYVELPRVLKRIGLPFSPHMLDMDPSEFSHECLQTASHKHHGGDLNAAASRILADFRRGYYGRVTLQIPPTKVSNRYCVPIGDTKETHKEEATKPTRVEYSQGVYEGW
ncbi:mitochondrial ribosome-associated GTPase 1 like protein [Babesia gibsoni]|uniref:Mitochondrial ribosome-associated GTPase 1 like protein n=1 Tax=Babesia gibsoni TaxID=33632 RepID=A0AAD8LII3_BABGI|nr:mitochondrial ribosome-associated GTPase 1 like protein [Babesia gibsoni]